MNSLHSVFEHELGSTSQVSGIGTQEVWLCGCRFSRLSGVAVGVQGLQ